MAQTTVPPTDYGFIPVGSLPNIILHGEYSREEEIRLAAETLVKKLSLPTGGDLPLRLYHILTTTFGALDDQFNMLKGLWGIPPVGERYKRGDPALYCKCGMKGIPSGSSQSKRRIYTCPNHYGTGKKKRFSERTSAEYTMLLIAYIALTLTRTSEGASMNTIKKSLGIPRSLVESAIHLIDRGELEGIALENIRSADWSHPIFMDAVFACGWATIILKIEKRAYFRIAQAEDYLSVRNLLKELRSIAPRDWRPLFVTDGSLPIRAAIEEVFPNAIHIRQFHGNSLGLVFVHFTYGGTPYTLVTRWDLLVEEERVRIRRATPGEKLLEKDEVLLYTGFAASPANVGLAEDPESAKLKGLGAAVELSSLPLILLEDLEGYRNRHRGRWSSKFSRLVGCVKRAKNHLNEKETEDAAEHFTEGLRAALELDVGRWPKKFRRRVWNTLKSLSLPESSGSEAVEAFREAKKQFLEKLTRGLVKIGGKNTERVKRSRRVPCKLIYRVRLSRDSDAARRIPALGYALRILERVFGNRYITTNPIEGYLGREVLLLASHRTERGNPHILELVFLLITKGDFTALDAVRIAPTRVQGRRPRRGSPHLPQLREGERYRIEYNTRGATTTRKIKVLKIHRFGRRRREQYVEAYCYLKNRKRTFRLDRITLITPIH